MTDKKIIIITVTKNDLTGLQATIKSLKDVAKYINSHVIVDGNSTDGTREILANYQAQKQEVGYDIIYKSEDDAGLYDAMNKAVGIVKSRDYNNNYLWFLNAGDLALYNDYSFLAKCKDNLLFFIAKFETKDGKTLHKPDFSITNLTFERWTKKDTPNHQAVLFSTNVINNMYFDTEFKIQADTKLIYSLYKKFGGVFHGIVICIFSYGGLSSTYTSSKKCLTQISEQLFILNAYRNMTWFTPIKLYSVFLIKYLLTKLLGDKLFSLIHFFIIQRK